MNTAKSIEKNKSFLKISKKMTVLGVLGVCGFLAFSPAKSDSLYPMDTTFGSGSNSLYSDVHALRIGDPVTVIISEANSGTVTSSSKATTSGSGTVAGTGPSANIAKTFGLNDTNSASSDGSTTHSGQMSATLTAIVMTIYNNGTMKIQGNRVINNNGVLETMNFSGIIRKQDIAADNTVQSKNVANAQITYTGKGDKKKFKLFGFITL
jgi:flagellar L-ring protein FlgH